MYIKNLDDKNTKGRHWVSLFIDINTAVYFDSSGIEYISREETKSKINQLLRIYLENKIMNLLCLHFIVSLS